MAELGVVLQQLLEVLIQAAVVVQVEVKTNLLMVEVEL
jgi:hypothetical protein